MLNAYQKKSYAHSHVWDDVIDLMGNTRRNKAKVVHPNRVDSTGSFHSTVHHHHHHRRRQVTINQEVKRPEPILTPKQNRVLVTDRERAMAVERSPPNARIWTSITELQRYNVEKAQRDFAQYDETRLREDGEKKEKTKALRMKMSQAVPAPTQDRLYVHLHSKTRDSENCTEIETTQQTKTTLQQNSLQPAAIYGTTEANLAAVQAAEHLQAASKHIKVLQFIADESIETRKKLNNIEEICNDLKVFNTLIMVKKKAPSKSENAKKVAHFVIDGTQFNTVLD